MTDAGWLLLCLSWGALGALAGYCLARTLRVGGLRHDHPPDEGDDAATGVAREEASD